MDWANTSAFLQNLIMSSVDGIIAADLSGRILVFNEAATKITGYPQEQALAHLNIRALYPGDEAREVMKRLRSDDLGGPGKLNTSRFHLVHQDGTLIPVNLSAFIVYDQGREVASVGFFRDLRDRMRLARELQETQVQLIQAEKMSSLGRLAAGVAHQLNNPLGGIVLFTRLLMEEEGLAESMRNDLARILGDAERCQHIVRELLDFSRQSSLEFKPHDLNQALNRVIFLLENLPLFRNIDIIRDFDSALPQVPADIQQLNHVFMNIILNAADAMAGHGRLRLKTYSASTGDRVRVEISDTGPGIPGDVLPHIFDPFFTTKEEGQGTGLGLSVAYGIIQSHGGRITACSALGEGATFVVELLLNPLSPAGGSHAGLT